MGLCFFLIRFINKPEENNNNSCFILSTLINRSEIVSSSIMQYIVQIEVFRSIPQWLFEIDAITKFQIKH